MSFWALRSSLVMNFADLGDSEQNKFCFSRLRQQLLYELQYPYAYMPAFCTLLFVVQNKVNALPSLHTQPFPTETAVPMVAVPRGLTAVARILCGCASAQSVPHKCHIPSSGAGLQGVPPDYWGKGTEPSWAAAPRAWCRHVTAWWRPAAGGVSAGVGNRPWGGSIICETPGLLQEM